MAYLKTVPTHECNRFTWKNGTGTTCASDLMGHRFGIESRIWDDAADVGFRVHNPKTGNTVLFAWSEDEYDADGDLTARVYRSHVPVNGAVIVVRIFND